jgi:hypothetical protein
MSDVFWLDDPKVLFNKNHITEILPPSNTSFERKLNAVTRLVILLTLLGYFSTGSVNILVSSIITLVIIVIVFKTQQTKQKKMELIKQIKKEGFSNPKVYNAIKKNFTQPTKKNPLMNVLLPEIHDNPKRKPAAPAFNEEVEKNINEKTADPRLFLDLGDKIGFEGSMRNFYATANTTIPNDQKGFAEFCFGDMPSCKEGDGLQCSKNNPRYTNY